MDGTLSSSKENKLSVVMNTTQLINKIVKKYFLSTYKFFVLRIAK